MGSADPTQGPQTFNLSSLTQALEALGASLQQIARAAGADHSAPPPPSLSDSLPLARAVKLYLSSQARLSRSDRYLRQLRVVLHSFTAGRAALLVDQITRVDVTRWVERAEWSPRTQRGYLGDVKCFLGWAQRRGLCALNAASDVRIPKVVDTRTPEVHTPEQVRKILETARRLDPDVCRILAIRYFAGLRSSEAGALREEDLRLGEGLLVVPAAKAKTRRRRVVTIEPVLASWLALGGILRGMRPLRIRQILRASGVPCPPNVARHSFCSYHLARYQNAARTAIEAGHAEAVLFAHYRAIVSPAQAREYWGLAPEGARASIPGES